MERGEGRFLAWFPGARKANDPNARNLTDEELGWIVESLEYIAHRKPPAVRKGMLELVAMFRGPE